MSRTALGLTPNTCATKTLRPDNVSWGDSVRNDVELGRILYIAEAALAFKIARRRGLGVVQRYNSLLFKSQPTAVLAKSKRLFMVTHVKFASLYIWSSLRRLSSEK